MKLSHTFRKAFSIGYFLNCQQVLGIILTRGGIYVFNSVEYVRDICSKRNIPISQLEKDCGFANGYMNPKKLKKSHTIVQK